MATKPRTTRTKQNKLSLEPTSADQLGKGYEGRRKKVRGSVRGRSHIGARKPPPAPRGKSREEIAEMDPDDPSFKIVPGKKRKTKEDRKKEGFKSVANGDWTKRARARRADVRKYEAEVVSAQREASMDSRAVPGSELEVVEANLIERGDLTLDDWTDEEVIRGYRRNRNGKFGPPPKWVPREVHAEVHRRIIQRGSKKYQEAYLASIDGLIELARGAESEKVKLEAMKEIQYRVAGKVPDKVAVSLDDPWADFLADAYVPISDLPPLEVEGEKRGVPDAPTPDSVRPEGASAARDVPNRQVNEDGKVVELFGEDFDE